MLRRSYTKVTSCEKHEILTINKILQVRLQHHHGFSHLFMLFVRQFRRASKALAIKLNKHENICSREFYRYVFVHGPTQTFLAENENVVK